MTFLPLQPLRIGSLTLDFPVVQAALSGYSDLPMRVIARRNLWGVNLPASDPRLTLVWSARVSDWGGAAPLPPG